MRSRAGVLPIEPLLVRNIVLAKTLVLAAVATAKFVFSNMNLDTDGSHFRWIRAIQGFGYGLFLVPVNLIAYSQLRPDQNNKPSSLTNLFRKWGGRFGIAFVTTATERRAELHQLNLGSHLGSSSQTLHDNSAGLIQQLTQYGLSSADAGTAKLAVFYRELLHQSEFLASMDCFRVFAWLSLVIFPFVLSVRRFKVGGQPTAGH